MIKKSISLFIIAIITTSATIFAQPCSVKLYEYISFLEPKNGDLRVNAGKEYNSFQVPEGASALPMFVKIPITNFKKITAKNRIHLSITTNENGNEYSIHEWNWPAVTKNTILSTDYKFPAGNYTISVFDNDNPTNIFAKRTITVTPNIAKITNAESGFPYDRKKLKIWTCASVDDNWKAVGVTNKMKVGGCITLFLESKDKIKNLGSMRWGIFKVEADGKETYVNQLDQGIGQLQEWRRLSYEECNAFAVKGKYRVYISTKDDADAYFGVNNKNYFAKVDIDVE